MSKKQCNSNVSVKIYGSVDQFENVQSAIDYYTEGCEYCDENSSEYSRYVYAIEQLESGNTFIDVDNAFCLF